MNYLTLNVHLMSFQISLFIEKYFDQLIFQLKFKKIYSCFNFQFEPFMSKSKRKKFLISHPKNIETWRVDKSLSLSHSDTHTLIHT